MSKVKTRNNLTDRIRATLRQEQYREDGLTATTLALLVGSTAPSVLVALKRMPDVWIHRRGEHPPHKGGRPFAVWKAVIPPPNCPPLPKKPRYVRKT